MSRLVALVLIGVLSPGLFTGLIEHAARTGWLKVTAGLIAGKQFILYRNPTFIGSGPECPIYLFRDPAVGRRHAAVPRHPRRVRGRKPTLGWRHARERPAPSPAAPACGTATRCRSGATRFRFQEKERK